MRRWIVGSFLVAGALSVWAARPLSFGEVEALKGAFGSVEFIAPAGVKPYVATNMNVRCSLPATAAFARAIVNPKVVKEALLVTTSRGVGEYYLNGETFAQETLKPGYTQTPVASSSKPRRHLYGYDVTEQWRKGEGATNLLAAVVSSGWYGDRLARAEGRIGGLWQYLRLTYVDGTSESFATGKDYRASYAGSTLYADIYYGQTIDGRQAQTFLSNPAASSHWPAPQILPLAGETLSPVIGGQIYDRTDLILYPASLKVYEGVTGANADCYGKATLVAEPKVKTSLKPGQLLVVDFAQNASARPVLTFTAPKGARLTVRFAEMLNDGNGAKSRGCDGPEGTPYLANMRTCPSQLDLISGGGTMRVRPTLSFWGYRYLAITTDQPCEVSELASIPVSSVTRAMERGKLLTGNEKINRLISNALWGMRSNYLSVPTDCPQRDERLGWMADTQVFLPTALCYADVTPFMTKFLENIRDTQKPSGEIPVICPDGWMGGSDYYNRFGWSDAAVIIPYTLWQQTGQREILERSYDSMKGFVTSIASNYYATATNSWQFADWLSFEQWETWRAWHTQSPERTSWWNFLGACYCAYDARLMMHVATVLGRKADLSYFRTLHAKTLAHIRQTWYQPSGELIELFQTQQTAYALPLAMGLIPAEHCRHHAKALAELVRRNGTRLSTGFLGTPALLEALSMNGESTLAYDLLLQEQFPSWLYSVNQGATTIWERWNSYTKERGFGPVEMNSFNHYAYGCVVEWLFSTAAGIRIQPDGRGKLSLTLAPIPDRRLGKIEATRSFGSNLVHSKWHYEGETWSWSFTIPEGSTALVQIPGSGVYKVYQSGTHTVTRPAKSLKP